MNRNLRSFTAAFLLCLCLSACDWSEEDTYSQVYADSGIKFGGTFIHINHPVTGIEITHGIDSSNLRLTIAECSGISIDGTYNPFAFLGNFKSQLSREIGEGVYEGTAPGSFIFVREMGPRKGTVNKTTISLSSQEMSCGLRWFHENVVLYE
ncbi:hypothetical protein ACFO5Q_01235 [Kordiimonas lipolytica]|uniref:Uncharacterized protein n=1 Tax=Kordiimonas lipolytica TaxID=1662421 RepID=A0ABV8U6R3_9PROT|nr:hypothetical protein [Kordiimonas lipolytica]